jgi:thiol-disulfide isomerase/thioredoxin
MSERRNAERALPHCAIAMLVGALLLGCGSTATHEAPDGRASAKSAPVATVSAPVELIAVDRAAYDAAVAKHHGQVVLVDFWATWCQPCVEQLPHTIELSERLADRGLRVVTVSCDEPTDADRIQQLLTDKQAGGATNLISQFGGSPQTMEAFEITSGAVPFYKLYDRAGKLRQTFGIDPAAKTQFTTGDIEAAVEQLLAE